MKRRTLSYLAAASMAACLWALVIPASPAQARCNRTACISGVWPVNVAFDSPVTATLLVIWRGPQCNVDLNGNGQAGGPMDRAVCLLRFLRGFSDQVDAQYRRL